MTNVQCIRQTGQQYDPRLACNATIFCRTDDSPLSSGLCLSDKLDEHGTSAHLQKQQPLSIVGTSNGQFIRKVLETKFNNHGGNDTVHRTNDHTGWLMMFIASKARLFCRRPKLFDLTRYPSLEHWIIVLNCHCSSLIDFYFDDPQANQCMCDYLDALALKG
jgi:hypothetical protein